MRVLTGDKDSVERFAVGKPGHHASLIERSTLCKMALRDLARDGCIGEVGRLIRLNLHRDLEEAIDGWKPDLARLRG